MTDSDKRHEPFLAAVGRAGPALLHALAGLEQVQRRLHPPAIPGLREALRPIQEGLARAAGEFTATAAPPDLAGFAEELGTALGHTERALSLFCDDGPADEAISRVLGSMSAHCRAQEALYSLRKALPPVGPYFVEPESRDHLEQLDPDPPRDARVGLRRAHNAAEQRGGFSFYVPESCSGDEPRPLIVALHGGSGHGADFIWTWLREAKSRRCLLLSPTSRGSTWSLNGPDLDAKALSSMVSFLAERWPVDPSRILLTGLSDGATYSLLCGLGDDVPFTALAPISGVLHPANLANGNLERAHSCRIFLAHGALDWMFPVGLAREAAEQLDKAGAQVRYREVADLSHTYPRELNAEILEWLDPVLTPVGRPPNPD